MRFARGTVRRTGTVAMAAGLLVVLGTASAADACRIKNENIDPAGDDGIKVWFDCGVACGNYFSVPVGTSVARPGQAGHVQACRWGGPERGPMRERGSGDARAAVNSDGEAVATVTEDPRPGGGSVPNFDSVTWVVYDKYDKRIGTTTHPYDWTPGDPEITDAKELLDTCWAGTA